MARSTGGGSRSGGSRRSGSRSRSRSRHRLNDSHYSSSNENVSLFHIHSRKPRVGCKKYIYYDKRNTAHFVYCDYDPAKIKPALHPILSICMIGIMLYIICGSVYNTVVKFVFWSEPISVSDNPDDTVVINDTIGAVTDIEKLTEVLNTFYTKTGVTPAVITVSDELWFDSYASLEYYATEQYYQYFNDEYHWLIVYSEPKQGYKDWKFEGVIGDYTVGAVSNKQYDIFTETLYNELYCATDLDVAIQRAFDAVLEHTRGIESPFAFFFEIVMVLVVLTGVFYYILDFCGVTVRRHKNAKQVADDVSIVVCEVCNGSYGSDEQDGCPHCRRAQEEYNIRGPEF